MYDATAGTDLNDTLGALYRLTSRLKHDGIIHPNFRFIPNPEPQPLTDAQWRALAVAERRIYRDNPGCNGWTDVMPNEGDEMLNRIWEQAVMGFDGTSSDGDEIRKLHQVARWVACALATLSFGPEILIA